MTLSRPVHNKFPIARQEGRASAQAPVHPPAARFTNCDAHARAP
ncbi:MAG: hypothetical protein R3B99_31945 [Polyangiales bacterium]